MSGLWYSLYKKKCCEERTFMLYDYGCCYFPNQAAEGDEENEAPEEY